MAEFNNFYQRAFYYDIVFQRDVTQEVDFIVEIYRQCVGDGPHSLLDLACGPGYHARNFARRGLRAVGLDLRQEMLAFANDAAAREGVHVQWLAADMRTFQLEHPVDVIINVFDGIDCLNSNEDLVAHLRAVGANLTPAGLYFIDVTNPYYTSFNSYDHFKYRGERDGVSVEILWATNDPLVNPLTSIANTQMEIHINDHGHETVVVDMASERVLSGQEISLLAELSGVLKPIAWYGGYDFGLPFEQSPQAARMIAVLQKLS